MRYLFAAIAVMSLSCAGPQVAPEVLRIVPLIKAEKYDGAAADPDLLAPAFGEALRQVQDEGADPKRILGIAEFFFEHYPFSIRDFALDDALFEAAAEAHFQATLKLKPALPACAKLAAARTVEEKALLLRSWEGPHDDGGRCAKNAADLLRRAIRAGPDWDFDPSLSRSKGKEPPGVLIGNLVEASKILDSWLFLCMPFIRAGEISENSERVLELARAAVEAAPASSSAGEAWLLMARAHLGRGRVAEAIACLEKAVAIPENACDPFEDESAAYARSDAGLMLANLHLNRREWDKSLAAWKSWKPYSMCANGIRDQDLDLSLGLGRCLEELGRWRDAADHYWNGTLNIAHSVEPAQRMLEVSRALGDLSYLQDRALQEAESRGEKLPPGLKWLADELKVPVK